ncbi:MAG: phosphoglycerate dehydrogenase [Eubacterium sp.]|nr:phosphoglycerate dehydrogenase [Eubacterium sp.]SEF51690.1 D-3-phosphoglycerate dehydrogenase [Eubacterium ruminantium]
MTKVNCLNPIAKCGTDLFTDDYQITEEFNEADVVLVRSAAMHDLEVSDKLLAVARAGAGVNNIPIDTYAEKGIVVFNTPGANANGVKELVIAGLLLGSRDIVGGANWVNESKEDADIAKTAEKKKKAFAGNEIQGKKLGVIGLGAIGALVANAAVSLGMEVYGYDPYVSVDAAWKLSRSVKHITNVNDIYSNCDYITVHVPLLDSTKGMINADAISRMKDGVVVLNFARDILIDEKALLDAIDEGHVKRYVTDFANPTVAGHKGVICTPHLGASTEESEDNCAVMAVKEIREFIENGNVINSVNFPRCEAGVCENASRVTVIHKNIPNMLTQFTGLCAKEGINVSEMVSKSKGDYAYTILDISEKATQEMVSEIAKIDGVVRVRIVK